MNLNDLSAAPLDDKVDFANLPSQGGGAPPPYPGAKRFKLPMTLTAANFKEYDVAGKKRLQVNFDDAAPLLIIQSAVADEMNTPFRTNLNNNARERGKKGSGVFASDMDYLLQACGFAGNRPANNRDFALAILGLAKEGKEFGGDIEWSWRCGDKRDARFPTEGGATTVVVDPNDSTKNIQGCGNAFYQQDLEESKKANSNIWPLNTICPGQDGRPCGASLRAFGNISRMRK